MGFILGSAGPYAVQTSEWSMVQFNCEVPKLPTDGSDGVVRLERRHARRPS